MDIKYIPMWKSDEWSGTMDLDKAFAKTTIAPPNVIYIDLMDQEIQDILSQIEKDVAKQLDALSGKSQPSTPEDVEDSFWTQEADFQECDA